MAVRLPYLFAHIVWPALSVIKAFGPMSESAAIVVAGQDQTDEAVAAIIDKFVYTELYTYKKGGRIYIWSEGGIRH